MSTWTRMSAEEAGFASPQALEEFFAKYVKAWADHDNDAIASMMTPDAIFEASVGPDAWGTRHVGREVIRQALIDGMAKAEEPNTRYWHDKPFIVGNIVFTEWTSSFTRKNGDLVCVHGCDIFELRDGLCSQKIAYRKAETPSYQVVKKG